MGAQIIMGFDHGNPLDAIIRGQLALRYHLMRDNLLLYDVDGSQVDEIHDAMAEKLYIDVLDRLEKYRHQTIAPRTAQGDRELINSGRESHIEDGVTIRKYLDAAASGTIELILPAKRGRRGIKHKTADLEPAVGSVLPDLTQTKQHSAALASQAMGWKWREGISSEDTLLLDDLANASTTQSLGLLMDEAVRQYVKMLPLTPKDMRLLNWHYANLEYSNASLSGNLSLTGWDQDSGNEFEGAHAHVIGGYQQLPRGLYMLPTKLDVRTNKAVSKVVYDPRDSPKKKAQVYCEDGEVIQADKVVFTASLGVLKKQAIQFEPELPEWKSGAIDRIGFGVMNKVILVFEKPFWDVEKDMFGLLRESKTANSLSQADYAPGRGKCYMFWNCMPTTGLPVLIGIMAGEAALEVGKLSDTAILTDIISQLRNVFKSTAVPDPVETIITRWGQDKFCYGSYSSVAPEAMPADYDLMAKSIGNLYFAGEATSRNHPATVHGAYLSGLRVASEVLESVMGPIQIPKPLVPPKAKATNGTPQSGNGSVAGQKRKSPDA
jgi:lysine-specific histone demethylase 1